MVIKIEGLQKSFPENGQERSILKGIDGTFVSGRLYVLKGRSGCGKSTLFSLIGLLDRPSSGAILFDGRDINAMSEKERERFRQEKISFLTQDENFIPEWDILDNLHLVSKDDERIDKAISKLGHGEKKKQKAESLSQGEKMRLAMARVLLEDRKILLLDEPTANLDETNARNLFNILEELSKTKVVIAISHDYREEDSHPGLVLLHLQNGKIVEETPQLEDVKEKEEGHLPRLSGKNYLSLSFLTVRKSLFRTILGFLLLSLISFVSFLFLSLLAFNPSPYLENEMALSPNNRNVLTFFAKSSYLLWLFLLASVLLFILTLYLLSFAYSRVEGKRMCLLRLIGFSEREAFFLTSIPLFLLALPSTVIGLVLYCSLHKILEGTVVKIFSSSSYPFLPWTAYLVLLVLILPLFALLFAFLKTHVIGRKLADQIKLAKE